MALSTALLHPSPVCKARGSLQLPHLIPSAQASPAGSSHSPSPFTMIRHRYASSTLQVLHTKRFPLPSPTALSTPQQVLLQWEEPKGQIAEIEAELTQYGCNIGPESILQALELVDLIERLGIQRYFETQIRTILRSVSVYTQLDDCKFGNAHLIVLAFRLLRLHGYPVSAGVFETLRDDENGFHAYFSISTYREVQGMIDLYRCSQLGFPGEARIMEEAKEFATTKLRAALSEGSTSLLETNNLKTAIIFALEFPRRYLLPRIESRSIMRQLWPAEGTRKYLDLAKFDLQMSQNLYRQELHELDRWWMQHGFDEIKCARKQNAKLLFSIATSIYEPQFSAHRMAFSKTANLTVVVDDMFDDKRSNPREFRRFNKALKRWDPSLLGDLPQHKLALMGLCTTVEDIAAQSNKVQNQDLLPLFKDLWIRFVGNYATEAEWIHSQHVPSLEEYLKVAHFSIGASIITWTSAFVIGEQITDEISSLIGIDSRFMYLVGLISRLSNDLVGFRKEGREGKVTTAVTCYMRDHPECSHEEAISNISRLIESSCQELEWEIYRARAKVPECCIRAVLAYARVACLIYKNGDGFSENVPDFMEIFQDYLFHSLE